MRGHLISLYSLWRGLPVSIHFTLNHHGNGPLKFLMLRTWLKKQQLQSVCDLGLWGFGWWLGSSRTSESLTFSQQILEDHEPAPDSEREVVFSLRNTFPLTAHSADCGTKWLWSHSHSNCFGTVDCLYQIALGNLRWSQRSSFCQHLLWSWRYAECLAHLSQI